MEHEQGAAGGMEGVCRGERHAFTRAEIAERMRVLSDVFDVVCLVDEKKCVRYALTEAGALEVEPHRCYEAWNRSERCKDCVSRRAMESRGRASKFEVVEGGLCHVIARYVEIDGAPCVLGMVSVVADEDLPGDDERQAIIHAISNYSRSMYIDPITGAYNRRYCEERCRELNRKVALAMLNIDGFRRINDIFGHRVGDEALKRVASAVFSCIRSTDMLVRYGGDEFLIVLEGIPEALLPSRLEKIRQKVENLYLDGYPELRMTASIGATTARLSMERMIGEAARQLRQAKVVRNCVCIDGAYAPKGTGAPER